jgi:hypothetical protein
LHRVRMPPSEPDTRNRSLPRNLPSVMRPVMLKVPRRPSARKASLLLNRFLRTLTGLKVHGRVVFAAPTPANRHRVRARPLSRVMRLPLADRRKRMRLPWLVLPA